MSANEILKNITAFIETKKKADKACYEVVYKLWQLMLKKADADEAYKAELSRWTSGEKSTVFLRDTLTAPFKDHDFDVDIWNPYDNAWISLDSWGAKVIHQQEMNIIDKEITLGNGEKIIYSRHSFFSNPIYMRENGKEPSLTIIDDQIYTIEGDDEPGWPIKKELQPAIFKTHTYSFSKGSFQKRVTGASL